MSRDDSAHFVAKWLDAEPWHRLLLVFESPTRRAARRLIESLGYELRSTALDSSDARIVSAKLGWWAEEWRLLAGGRPRHPMTIALATMTSEPIDLQSGGAWIAAAADLADDISDASTNARIQRWQHYTHAQSRASQRWLPVAEDDARVHATALLVERIAHAQADLRRGRLPMPLDAMVHGSLTRAHLAEAAPAAGSAWVAYAARLRDALRSPVRDVGGYRRAQAALARMHLRSMNSDLRMAVLRQRPLPPIRSAFAAWRAFRSP